MSFSLPPVVRLAERVLADIENAACAFPRKHRYGCGEELRRSARAVAKTSHRAWRDRARVSEWTGKLVWAVDDLKLELQVAQRLKAFRSFREFEALSRLVVELGRQAGGWHRQQQHPKGQSSAAPQASRERAQILSTRAASQRRANP